MLAYFCCHPSASVLPENYYFYMCLTQVGFVIWYLVQFDIEHVLLWNQWVTFIWIFNLPFCTWHMVTFIFTQTTEWHIVYLNAKKNWEHTYHYTPKVTWYYWLYYYLTLNGYLYYKLSLLILLSDNYNQWF